MEMKNNLMNHKDCALIISNMYSVFNVCNKSALLEQYNHVVLAKVESSQHINWLFVLWCML